MLKNNTEMISAYQKAAESLCQAIADAYERGELPLDRNVCDLLEEDYAGWPHVPTKEDIYHAELYVLENEAANMEYDLESALECWREYGITDTVAEDYAKNWNEYTSRRDAAAAAKFYAERIQKTKEYIKELNVKLEQATYELERATKNLQEDSSILAKYAHIIACAELEQYDD